MRGITSPQYGYTFILDGPVFLNQAVDDHTECWVGAMTSVPFLVSDQEAGPRSADPNWRSRPMVLPKFGCPAHQDATLPCTPGQSQPSLPLIPNGVPSANGHAAAAGSFRFGVPSAKHLSFAGPGGDAFAEGEMPGFLEQQAKPCFRSCKGDHYCILGYE